MWGTIEQGDHLPYLPQNQVTVNVGLLSNNWEMGVIARYIDEMQEASGDNVLLSDVVIESYTVFDFSATYDLDTYGLVYFKVDNLLDNQVIVSRRPYGARPSKPQQFQLGYQYRF
jgi:Fe(3+) dicitrate transport protein